jgi:cell wall-associated NlpC family hydrolase
MVRVFLLSAIMVMALAGFASAAESEQAIAVGATTGSSLRLREEPTTSASIVTTLNKGVAVAILDDSTDGWYKISYNGSTGYVSSDYMIVDRDNLFTTYGRTNADSVNVRSSASTDSEVLASIATGTIVTINGFENGWYKVTCKYGTEGYIRSDLLDMTSSATSSSAISETALQHLGTRYVWGGSSAGGFDCSGFTMYVYKQFGYSLPHTATGQWQSGIGTKVYSISELQPGDLVFFNDPSRNAGKACSHAGIYIGNGQHIHASSAKDGVVISSLTSGYYNQYFIGGIHV